MQLDQDTIVAVATPPGRGGIGVVRLSGPHARSCVSTLLDLRGPLLAGKASFTHVVDANGERLDEAVVTLFEAPHSYTSEDVVEIAAHGAPVLLEFLVRGAVQRGARLAEPGEFTQRAFLSGRLDLTQAEAVNDLIAAQTLHQAKVAAAQLGGSIARIVSPIKQQLIALIAALEAGVDFAEDDLDLLREPDIVHRIEALIGPLRSLVDSYSCGRMVREGVRLAIIGQPNAGKSSLFNRLLDQQRAIVTAQPGTTRDLISETLSIGGIPITLTDTAGLRDVADLPEHEAEREGIQRSRATMAEADLVLHIVDATTLHGGQLSLEDADTQHTLAGRPSLLVLNKSDLVEVVPKPAHALVTSAETGDGIVALRQAIFDQIAEQPQGDSAMITNLRQVKAIQSALDSLQKARTAAEEEVPHEFLLLDLHESLEALDLLTGASTPDDILSVIFSSFCIGK